MRWRFFEASPARKLGILSVAIERFFFALQYVSIANVLFKTRKGSQELAQSAEEREHEFFRRSRMVEGYIVAVLVLEIFAFLTVTAPLPWFAISALVIAIWRLVDLFQAALNIAVLDILRMGARPIYLVSSVRTVLLSLVNFGETMLCFAIVYSFDIRHLFGASGRFDALYFSVITQLTVGYGDLQPRGPLRLVASCQAGFGFVLAVVLISRIMALLPPVTDFLESGKSARTELVSLMEERAPNPSVRADG